MAPSPILKRRAAAAALLAFTTASFTVPPVSAGAAAFRDAVGRSVEIPATPQRIVSLAPNVTEILFALGRGEAVAGVTQFCDFPPEARSRPKIGGFVNPSLERIVALEPDLVVATADGNLPETVHRLASLGVPVYVVDTPSLEGVFETIRVLGRITGAGERARELVGRLSGRAGRLRFSLEGRERVSVFVALDREPLISAAEGTFVDELVALAGGRNVARDAPVKYPLFSLEELLYSDPEVIVAAVPPLAAAGSTLEWLARIPGGGGLRALRGDRVFDVGEGDFFLPGPRIVGSLEALAAMLHPEAVPQ